MSVGYFVENLYFVMLNFTVLPIRQLRSGLCSRKIETRSGGFQSTLIRLPIFDGKMFKITVFRGYHARNVANRYRYICLYIIYAFIGRMTLTASQSTCCVVLR
jgi:hypothetical protein